jgi:hypothetical protein
MTVQGIVFWKWGRMRGVLNVSRSRRDTSLRITHSRCILPFSAVQPHRAGESGKMLVARLWV